MTIVVKQRNEQAADAISEMPGATEVNAACGTSGDGEFKLTVRKLEMPVRPRGVLAE
jgi:hypothetical protein